jgi:hypothetical protein
MDRKDKEPKGTGATASKMAADKKQDESPSPGQGATSSQTRAVLRIRARLARRIKAHQSLRNKTTARSVHSRTRAHRTKKPAVHNKTAADRICYNKPSKQPTKL